MARLYTTGFELADDVAEGVVSSGVFAFSTARPRTGARSFRTSAGFTGWQTRAQTPAGGTAYFLRVYFNIDVVNMAAWVPLVRFTNAGITEWVSVGVNNGFLALDQDPVRWSWFSGATLIEPDRWYRLEVRVQNISATTILDISLDGTTLFGESADPSLFGWTQVEWGTPGASPAYTSDIYFDDVALNDTNGANQNSYPGAGQVYVLRPASDPGLNPSTWVKPGGSGTSRHTALDNVPPVYLADSAAAGDAEKMVRQISADPNNDIDFDTPTYTAAGIPAGDTITFIQTLAVVGSPDATDTAGQLTGVSNPTVAALSFAAFDNGVASATPGSWRRVEGNVLYNPSVTRGTAHRIRVRKVTGASRVVLVNAMALTVETFTPPVAKAGSEAPVATDARTLEVGQARADALAAADAASAVVVVPPGYERYIERVAAGEHDYLESRTSFQRTRPFVDGHSRAIAGFDLSDELAQGNGAVMVSHPALVEWLAGTPHMKPGVPIPNLVQNSSFEDPDFAGFWATYQHVAGGLADRMAAAFARSGDHVCRLTAAIGQTELGVSGGGAFADGRLIKGIVPGRSYSACGYTWASGYPSPAAILFAWYTDAVVHISSDGTPGLYNNDQGWTRTVVHSAVAPPGAARVGVYVTMQPPAPFTINDRVHYVDDVRVLEGAYTAATWPEPP